MPNSDVRLAQLRDAQCVIVRTLLSICLLVGMSAPAVAADRTRVLLEELDRCDPARPETWSPKLDVLLALADGRSAEEFASVVGRSRRQCTGYVTTYGVGPDELIFVGGLGGIGASGALLWVDQGYWRIAALPLGYVSGTREVRRHGE